MSKQSHLQAINSIAQKPVLQFSACAPKVATSHGVMALLVAQWEGTSGPGRTKPQM